MKTSNPLSNTWQQQADLLASSTLRCSLPQRVELTDYIVPEEGYCVAVKALAQKDTYGQVECTDRQFRKINKGDVLVGVLGSRRALKGYCGMVPSKIEVGDTLNVLNLGGIIGKCTSELPDLGPALPVEVLGAVLAPGADGVRHASIRENAIQPCETLTDAPPLVIVSGTAMNTGKTTAACQIVSGLQNHGLTVDAAKLTGASLMRDVQSMKDHGARNCLTFTDTGIPCTTDQTMRPFAKGIISRLAAEQPDAIVLEMGDGLIGYYGVDELLRDREIQQFTKAHVVAATDLSGVWAADRLFHERYRSDITAITGPVTDNEAGKAFIKCDIGVPALNALDDAKPLSERVLSTLKTAHPQSSPALQAS